MDEQTLLDERASVRKGMHHDKLGIQISGFGEDTAGEWSRVRNHRLLLGRYPQRKGLAEKGSNPVLL